MLPGGQYRFPREERVVNRNDLVPAVLVLGMALVGCSEQQPTPKKAIMLPMEWKKLLAFHPLPNGVADESTIRDLEKAIGTPLPTDYREFLMTTGGGYVRGLAECTCPTPFGESNITELHDVKQIIDHLDSSVTPRNMICIGYGHFGMTTCLSIAGLDHGQVFALDTEMRFYWTEEELSRLPALAPSIKGFFRQRDAGELPRRPWGYTNCYHIADSFSEYLSKLKASE